MGETYYDVLEIDSDATREEIRTAYRERVLETHPDHNDAADATEQFQQVSRAKSVLTDGTERARYDRLGHDAYVQLAQYGGTSQSTDGTTAEKTSQETSQSAADRTETATSQSGDTDTATDRRTGSRDGRTRSTTDRTTTHDTTHQTTAHQDADSRSFESDDVTAETTQDGTERSTQNHSEDTAGEFRYSVHDWNDDVDLEWEGRPLDHTTAVTIGCLWVLYPVLVASSLTALFPTVVNAIVATCTLGIVAYVLLRPRIAAGVFGSWSLAFPIGLTQFEIVAPTSVLGLIVLGFAWIPFGYAVGLWWALRP